MAQKLPNINLVDIGASGGIQARWKNSVLKTRAVLFEPDPREYHKLKATVEGDHIVLNSALSDAPREVNLNLCRDQKASSLYPPDLEILGRYYSNMDKFDVVQRASIVADTLDSQLTASGQMDVDFIKLDVQGSELPILSGGTNTLRNVLGIEVEVEFIPVYKGQPVFPDVHCFLVDAGFELFDIRRTYRNRENKMIYGNRKGQLLWGDALYFKAPERVLSIPGIEKEKILRAIGVFLAYNYPDLAETLYKLAKERVPLSAEEEEWIKVTLARYHVKGTDFLGKSKRAKRLLRGFANWAETITSKRRTDKQEDKILGNS